jgi:hypothetical protein
VVLHEACFLLEEKRGGERKGGGGWRLAWRKEGRGGPPCDTRPAKKGAVRLRPSQEGCWPGSCDTDREAGGRFVCELREWKGGTGSLRISRNREGTRLGLIMRTSQGPRVSGF